MSSRLKALVDQGVLSPLSYFFARFLAKEYQLGEESIAVLSAALVSERNQHGEPCIDLSEFAGKPLFDANPEVHAPCPIAPEFNDWVSVLKTQPCIGDIDKIAPLVLESPRLYLGKFWHYEKQVQQSVLQRLQWNNSVDEARLRQGLERLFPTADENNAPDWQKLACALAVCQRFTIISGGPGTGKTTTVVKVLALLLEQNPEYRIRLAAPTGKAATRMIESVRDRKTQIFIDSTTRSLIPDKAATLHRLLEYDGRRFQVDGNNPLLLDCLVVDEASMIDLPLMARLLAALPNTARLILIGDRDQLASVEAGNVLADLTGNGLEIQYSESVAEKLAHLSSTSLHRIPVGHQVPRMANSIALLQSSYRFDSGSGIGRLAALVNQGCAERALMLAQNPDSDQIEWREVTKNRITEDVLRNAVRHYQNYLEADSPAMALEQFEQFRVLCATQQGSTGVLECNRLIEAGLFPKSRQDDNSDFHGKAIMITVNDYEMGLFNGDIGLFWTDQRGQIKAWFKDSEDQIRDLPIRSLPQYVPAWAITVHKSQGSEFDSVLLILPEEFNRVVCRELIYTAITRCRKSVVLHSSRKTFIRGVERKLSRSSGLAAKLGWSDRST